MFMSVRSNRNEPKGSSNKRSRRAERLPRAFFRRKFNCTIFCMILAWFDFACLGTNSMPATRWWKRLACGSPPRRRRGSPPRSFFLSGCRVCQAGTILAKKHNSGGSVWRWGGVFWAVPSGHVGLIVTRPTVFDTGSPNWARFCLFLHDFGVAPFCTLIAP